MTIEEAVLTVEGLTCSACVRHLEHFLRGFGKVRVEHNATETTPRHLMAAMADGGYKPRPSFDLA